MAGELPAAGNGGLFASLSPARAEALRDSLMRYAVGGEDQLRAQVAQLDTLRRLQHELAELDETIMRLEVGSQADLEQYREVTLAIGNAEETLAGAQQAKGLQTDRLAAAKKAIEDLETEIETLQESHERAGRDRAEAQYIQKVRGALHDLRDALRQKMRGRLEAAINARFADLVHDHKLIARIGIDDRYTLSFHDAQGQSIGRASLSSGLKQLAATALMWAMKEVSDFQMPVVIDTPLGRIDLENQENMLRNYYPNLAHQVIILPTNAEIDKAKFPWIADHVGVQYRIVNETGDRARVEAGSLLKN
jgi:DNA sulfur modification protein DndD